MKHVYLLISGFLFWATLVFGQQEQYAKLRIYLDGRPAQDLLQLGITCDHGEHRRSVYFESDFSTSDRRLLEASGFRYDVLIEDVVAYYQNQNRVEHSGARNTNCIPHGGIADYPPPNNFALGTMGGYLTYQELLDNLDSMRSKYPHLITAKKAIDSTNLTHENRPIYWVKISGNPDVDENEPAALYNALHHAREPLALSQLIYYMWYLLENYTNNTEIQYLLDHAALYFVPCVNPDGYVYNELTNPNGGGMWRKNRRNNGGSYGVDLNRNYDYAFAQDNVGSSALPSSNIYRGPTAFSEPETQNMRDFCEAHDFMFSLNYHSYGDLLIYPWAYNSALTPDSNEYKTFARVMTQENRYNYGTNMETIGYSSNGDADDWFYGEQTNKKKIFALTPEVGTGGFWPAATSIVGHCQRTMWQNLALAHLLLNYGEVIDNSTGLITELNAAVFFELTRYGMMNGDLTVRVAPLSSNIQSVGAAKVFNLTQFANQTDSIRIHLDPTISNGDVVRYVLILDNGFYTQRDTIERVFGNYALFFSDSANTMNNWTNPSSTSNWEVTHSTFHSPTGSLTDSKIGNYGSNTTTEIVLNQNIDLSVATDANLSFWAKWDIEEDYDYVQVMAAGSDSIYKPLCGWYTNLGTMNQDINQPLYDGIQNTWVAEQMSLNDFLGDSIVQIKLRLVADIWISEDGFYFDDFKVNVLEPGLHTPQQYWHTRNFALEQNQPNPAGLKVFIPFEIPSSYKEAIWLEITDVLGQRVHFQAVGQNSTGIELEIETWEEGVYFYRLLGNDVRSLPRRMLITR